MKTFVTNHIILMNILGLSIAASAFWFGQFSGWFGLLLPIGFGVANVSNCIASGKNPEQFIRDLYEDG